MKAIKALFVVILLSLFVLRHAEASHTVKSGESLWSIAKQYKMAYTDILTLNPQFKDPNVINIGDSVVVRSGDTATDLTDYAKALQSITVYQYGGQNAPYNTDCSGWTQHIYKQFGYTLPRVSRQQANVGTPIKFGDMKKGDLMFFSTRDDKVISHVGIYLGNDQWISNLSSKQNVKVLSTWGSWTQKYFLWAQRVI